MGQQRYLLIANPTAGVGAGRVNKHRLLEVAVRDLERDGGHIEVTLEDTREGVEAQAERGVREEFDGVISAGGDGTVNAVLNGLLRAGTGANIPTLGVLPMGTGNVFAFNLGIDRSWREACRVIRKGYTRVIDVGLAAEPNGANSQYFVLMAGVGFDAKVVEDTSLRLKYVLREFAYVVNGLQNAVVHKGSKVTLTFDEGEVFKGKSWLIMAGNAASYAWDIKFTELARLDDGHIDVCLMPFHNKMASVQQVMAILTGQHVERGIARYWKTTGLTIESDPPIPVQLDGDEWGRTPVQISVHPGVLRVFAPEPRPATKPAVKKK
jgi:YegS/Rv2252/BmrU family lipid kinase